METLDDLVDAFDVKGLLGDVKKAGEDWLEANKPLVQEIGKDGARAVVYMAILEAMPDDIDDPDLNIKKMEYAAKLAELAAEHQEALDQAKASAKSTIMGVIQSVLGRVTSVALKAATLAVLA